MARRKRPEPQKRVQTTRKDMLRHRKSARERRLLLTVLVPIVAVVLVIVGGGAYREMVQKPNQPVARVQGVAIPASHYTARLAYERLQLLNSLQSFAQYAQVQSGQDDFLKNFADQSRSGLPERTLDSLIDEQLIREEAEKRGIEVTDADVTKDIYSQLPSATALENIQSSEVISITEGVTSTGDITTTGEMTATDGLTSTDGVTTTAATTPTLTDEQVVGATREANQDYETYIRQAILERTGISESRYREIVRNQLLRKKLQEALGKEVATEGEHVEAAYLSFSSPSTAEEAAAALAAGSSWDEVVEQFRSPENAAATSPVTATNALTFTQGLTGTEAITTTIGGSADVAATPTATATETAEPTATETAEPTATQAESATAEPPTTSQVGPITSTGATAADPITATGAITATGGLTSTLPSPTPAPTAIPDPYWGTTGERGWYSRQGLKDGLGLSDTEATELLEAEPNKASRLMDGTQGTYLIYVFAKDETRELSKEELQTRKDAAIDDWLSKRRIEVGIDRFPLEGVTPPEPDWFVTTFDSIVGTPLQTTEPIIIGTVIATAAPPPEATSAP